MSLKPSLVGALALVDCWPAPRSPRASRASPSCRSSPAFPISTPCRRAAIAPPRLSAWTSSTPGPVDANPVDQLQIVQNLINQGVEAISVSILDASALAPLVDSAKAAHLHLFTSDSDAPKSGREVYVAQATDEGLGNTLLDEMVVPCRRGCDDRFRLGRCDGVEPQHLDRHHAGPRQDQISQAEAAGSAILRLVLRQSRAARRRI